MKTTHDVFVEIPKGSRNKYEYDVEKKGIKIIERARERFRHS